MVAIYDQLAKPISTAIAKQNNPLAIDTDMVNISTINATLNNQMDVDSIVTRMKLNKRRRNRTYNRPRKKSHKIQAHNPDISSSDESSSYEYEFTPRR